MSLPRLTVGLAGLALAACGSQPTGNEASVANTADDKAEAKAALPRCPFQEIQDLRGSITGGRLLVTGRVDLMMAGFKPQLTPRAGSGGLVLDLALVPEANAVVSNELRYEHSGSPAHRQGEVWCGGQRIAGFDIVLVG